MANEIKKKAGVSGNSVAGKSYQIFTVSEELLAKVVEAVQAGEKEARSSGNIQSFEVFCHGFRANIALGRIMVVPAKVCNDRKNFPTALLHGAIIRVFGTGGEEVADLVEKKIGESEFDEYSQADFDTIKKEIFTDKATGEEASLVVFAPNWMNSREYICFHFSDDAEQLKNDLRHQVFSAYYNPAVSSAFNALMTNVDTTKVDVTDITPKLSYPFLTENPLRQFPNLEKQAGWKKATILLNRKTADDITKQTLDPQELDVFDSLNQALENSIMPETTSVEDAGEGGFRAPDDGGVPREASAKQAEEHEVDLGSKGKFDVEKGGLHKALGIPEDQTISMDKLHSVMNGDYPEHVKNMARSAIGLKSMHKGGKVAHIGADGVCPGCKRAGNECSCQGCTCKQAAIQKVAYVKHCPGHKNSKGEAAPWCIYSHETGKILSSHSSKAEAEAHLQQMHAHSGSVEIAPHEAPFTNVGPGSAANDAQEASAPAMKESVTEDAGKEDELTGGPIGIAIDETGVPRSKTEESEGKSKSASKKAVQVQNPSNRKRENSHPETLRVGPDRLSSAMSATFNGGYRDVTATDGVLRPYTEKTGLGNNADYPSHAAADHEKQIAAGAYGEDPLNRRSNEKWGSATVNVNFKRSTAAQTYPTGDDFTDAYIEAALWAETDPDTMQPLDRDHDYSDIAPATLERFKQDCAKFQKDNAQLLEQAYQRPGYNGSGEWTSAEQAGHDFWLTRNGHGAGFWDRDALKGGLGDALTKAAKAFREAELYVGDDGMIYQMGAEGTSPASYVASQVSRTASAPFEAMSIKAKAARARKESLLDKFRPKTAVELDIDSIWDAITEDMGPAPLVDVPELGDTNPNPSNTEQHEGFDEAPKAPSKSPNKKDIGDLPEAFRSDEPEEKKEISDSDAESQETELENSATESEDEGEKKWHEANWNPDSKFADFINEVAEDIENEETVPRMSCDQCQMMQIQGVPTHETGCPNQGARWDAENGMWIPQRECFECGSEVDEDDPCCSRPVMDEADEARYGSVEKEATGEMDQSDADDPTGWPLHHAIANALGGKVKAFDQYQGPYVLIGSEVRGQGTYAPATPMKGTVRLWISPVEDSRDTRYPEVQVYNEDNEKLSAPFLWNDEEAAVEAAKSVLDTPPPTRGKAMAVGASTKKADTADNGYDIDKAPNPSGKEKGPSDTVECHQDYNTERSEGTDRPKPEAGADIKQAGGVKRMYEDEHFPSTHEWSRSEDGPVKCVHCGARSGSSEAREACKSKQAGPKKRVYEDAMIDNEQLLKSIRHGDRVTILRPAGMGRGGQEWKEATGTAVMHSAEGGWVLNMGGPHGTPGLANERNIVRVKKGKPVPGQERLGSGKKADTADNPANWKGGEGIIQPKTDADIKDTTGPDAQPQGQKAAANYTVGEWKVRDGKCNCPVFAKNGHCKHAFMAAEVEKKKAACNHQPHDDETTQTTCERCGKELYYNAKTDRWTTSKSKKADGISGDAAEAKSETVSPDTVDRDIQQPTVSVEEAGKTASWMNEYDIDEAVRDYVDNPHAAARFPVRAKATEFLREFRDEVNSHSDGWAYWRLPANAAKQLMDLIQASRQEPEILTEQAFRKALGPIKSFMTRRGQAAGMQMPKLAAAQYGSQLRELIADSGYELVRLEGEPGSQTAILHPVNGGPDEMWYESDDHAGYTIEIEGTGYEFGRDVPRLVRGADISGDVSEAKSETDYNKTDVADNSDATDTVNPDHFAAIGERNDDVPVSQGDIPNEKQPKSDLGGVQPEAHDVPPQADGKVACGEGHPESVRFDWGAGDLADIVLIEDEDENKE